MKIGFIGLGNMATAMIGGMLRNHIVMAEEMIGSDKTAENANKAAEAFQMSVGCDNRKTAEEADVLFLCVKPIFLPDVMEEIKSVIRENTVIVSIVAGQSLEKLAEGLGPSKKIIRCMPNTPALVGEGCTAMCPNGNVGVQEKEYVLRLLSSFGTAVEVPERMMDAVVGISGSSPAYVFIFIEAMADAAVAAGMPRKQAYEMAAQAVLGSAKMVLETGMHPGELKDMVCSPGGTTIEAVKVLEKKGLRAAVIEAMEACMEKSKTL